MGDGDSLGPLGRDFDAQLAGRGQRFGAARVDGFGGPGGCAFGLGDVLGREIDLSFLDQINRFRFGDSCFQWSSPRDPRCV